MKVFAKFNAFYREVNSLKEIPTKKGNIKGTNLRKSLTNFNILPIWLSSSLSPLSSNTYSISTSTPTASSPAASVRRRPNFVSPPPPSNFLFFIFNCFFSDCGRQLIITNNNTKQ